MEVGPICGAQLVPVIKLKYVPVIKLKSISHGTVNNVQEGNILIIEERLSRNGNHPLHRAQLHYIRDCQVITYQHIPIISS